MKITKPNKLGVLKKTYTFLRQHYLVITPIVFFNLRSGQVLNEMSQWGSIKSALGPTNILDMAMPKPCGEVLLSGAAFASEKETNEMTVSMRLWSSNGVSKVDKSLIVSGNRKCRRSLIPSEVIEGPEVFDKIPLHAGNAFGGEGFKENPSGKGYISSTKKLFSASIEVDLPNIEEPYSRQLRIGEKIVPAGFDMLDIALPPRNKKAGTFDKNWLDNHFPGYAPDMDWSIFNAARDDQQIKGYWEGNELYELKGLHPTEQTISGALPQVKARAFIRNNQSAFIELDTKIDTLWFFPEFELGCLLFRSVEEIEDSDGRDISDILLAYESMSETPRSQAYYQEVLSLRTDTKTAMAHVFNESQLSPEKTEQEKKRDQSEIDREKQRQKEKQGLLLKEMKDTKKIPDYDEKLAESMASDHHQPSFPVIAPEALERGDLDLSKVFESINQQSELVKTNGKKQLATLDEKQQELKQELAKEELQESSQDEGLGISKENSDLDKKSNESDDLTDRFMPEKLRFDNIDLYVARRHSVEPHESINALPPKTSAELREKVEERIRNDLSLAECDLSGGDFSGMDFSGLDLTKTLFECCNLENCMFKNCCLKGAVITKSKLSNACFEGADLSNTNLSKTVGTKTNFSNANLTNAWLMEADLKSSCWRQSIIEDVQAQKLIAIKADFSEALVKRTMFIQADLSDSDWQSSQLSESMFIEGNLNFCRFQGAKLFRCVLTSASASVTNFSDASLERVQTGGEANFISSIFYQSKAKTCGFRSIDMSHSNFSKAVCVECDFGETTLVNCQFEGANLSQSIISSAVLSESQFISTNFYKVKARKAIAEGAVFDNANFMFSDWQLAKWKHCENKEAKNLNDTCLEIVE